MQICNERVNVVCVCKYVPLGEAKGPHAVGVQGPVRRLGEPTGPSSR